jgi:hypothetical protein
MIRFCHDSWGMMWCDDAWCGIPLRGSLRHQVWYVTDQHAKVSNTRWTTRNYQELLGTTIDDLPEDRQGKPGKARQVNWGNGSNIVDRHSSLSCINRILSKSKAKMGPWPTAAEPMGVPHSNQWEFRIRRIRVGIILYSLEELIKETINQKWTSNDSGHLHKASIGW